MPPNLEGISLENLKQIAGKLDYASTVALSWSSKYFWENVKLPETYRNSDLLQIELWPEYCKAVKKSGTARQMLADDDLFACHICKRIRLAEKFGKKKMKGVFGKYSEFVGKSKDRRHERHCLSCGWRTELLEKGAEITFGGDGQDAFMVYCKTCSKLCIVEGSTIGGDKVRERGVCVRCTHEAADFRKKMGWIPV